VHLLFVRSFMMHAHKKHRPWIISNCNLN